METQYIPPATLEKIESPAPVGTRNKTAIEIAMPLIGNGMSEEQVFGILRGKFEPDVTDAELWRVVRWCQSKHPTPSTPSGQPVAAVRSNNRVAAPANSVPTKTPQEQVAWWTSDTRTTPDEMSALSPTMIPDSQTEACALALSSLYSDVHHLNIVCGFTEDGSKTRPTGPGKVLTRDGWLDYLAKKDIPSSQAGAWFRINPCAQVGSGAGGAITDADVTEFRFLLLESDCIPVSMQLAFFYRLQLPIAAIVLSGGNSAHAWVKIGAPTGEKYAEVSKRILDRLKPFGIDQANKNPSRLSRLPGAVRKLGATESGLQRLVWLNPNAAPITDSGIKLFEQSLEFPAIEEKPLMSIASAAQFRYEDMKANVGKLGVTTGIPQFDAISGGFKPGHTVVVAGQTGGGKSTYALHIINAALTSGVGVLLFSLEMDREEIFDLLVSSRCQIDRNKFNTGRFVDYDFELIAKEIPTITKLPLYIEDSAMSGVDQVRTRTLQLKAAGKIGLVVVDYIQFINVGVSRDSREQQVAAISHALRALAREVKLPFIVLSQLNDEGKLRESRVIAHNANIVMVVETSQEKPDNFRVNVIKGRGTPTGSYDMEFDRRFARLVPKEIHDDEDREL